MVTGKGVNYRNGSWAHCAFDSQHLQPQVVSGIQHLPATKAVEMLFSSAVMLDFSDLLPRHTAEVLEDWNRKL